MKENEDKEKEDEPEAPPNAGSWLTFFVKQSGPYMEAAYMMTGGLLGLGLLGYFLDSKLATSPACLLGGLFLGLAVGFYGLAKVTFKK